MDFTTVFVTLYNHLFYKYLVLGIDRKSVKGCQDQGYVLTLFFLFQRKDVLLCSEQLVRK